MKRTVLAVIVACGAVAAGGAAGAGAGLRSGPPLVCHGIDVGDAACPSFERGSDRSGLVARVTDALKTERDPLVRMETLRRGAVAISQGKDARGLGWELLGRLSAIALEQEAAGGRDAQAWFDVGFLVGALRQAGVDLDWRAGVADGIDGYAYVQRGLELAREDKAAQLGALELGAALLTLPEMHGRGRSAPAGEGKRAYDGHIRAAAALAAPGSLVEKNLASHLAEWGTSLERVRRPEVADRR